MSIDYTRYVCVQHLYIDLQLHDKSSVIFNRTDSLNHVTHDAITWHLPCTIFLNISLSALECFEFVIFFEFLATIFFLHIFSFHFIFSHVINIQLFICDFYFIFYRVTYICTQTTKPAHSSRKVGSKIINGNNNSNSNWCTCSITQLHKWTNNSSILTVINAANWEEIFYLRPLQQLNIFISFFFLFIRLCECAVNTNMRNRWENVTENGKAMKIDTIHRNAIFWQYLTVNYGTNNRTDFFPLNSQFEIENQTENCARMKWLVALWPFA